MSNKIREQFFSWMEGRRKIDVPSDPTRIEVWQAAHEMYAPKECKWKRDTGNEDFYETECGSEFYMPDGLGEQSDVKYCCYCGGKATETGAG